MITFRRPGVALWPAGMMKSDTQGSTSGSAIPI